MNWNIICVNASSEEVRGLCSGSIVWGNQHLSFRQRQKTQKHAHHQPQSLGWPLATDNTLPCNVARDNISQANGKTMQMVDNTFQTWTKSQIWKKKCSSSSDKDYWQIGEGHNKKLFFLLFSFLALYIYLDKRIGYLIELR